MTKTKSTKRALLMSALALLMCVSMLIGSTFAWFTDSVTSAGNIIQSGTLDVEMYWKDATATGAQQEYKDASEGAIFNYDKWEPGYVEAKNIKISNEGTLALKYALNIFANGEVSKLADVIDVYYIEDEVTLTDRADIKDEYYVGTLTDILAGMPANASGDLLEDESDVVTIALKMQETAGNEYQNLSIGSDFAVQLLATQLTAEKDSFNNQYDADATFDKWSGAVETDWYAADATEYTLSSAEDLAGLAALVNEGTNFKNKIVKLDANVNLNGVEWTPIGVSSGKGFSGTFDGQGHTIANLQIIPGVAPATGTKYGAGLFGNMLSNSAVKNLTIADATCDTRANCVGVVAGYVYGSATFENIKVTNADIQSFAKVGGIVGLVADPGAHTIVLKNCDVDGTLGGAYNMGGLMGLVLQGVTVEMDADCSTDVDFILNDSGYNRAYTRDANGNYVWNYSDQWKYAAVAENFCYYNDNGVEYADGLANCNGVAQDVLVQPVVTTAAQLQGALDTYATATEDTTIVVAGGTYEGSFTLTQNANAKLTLKAVTKGGVTFTKNEAGVIFLVDGNSNTNNADVVIDGFNFAVNHDDAYAIQFGSGSELRYANHVTVQNCAFTGTGYGVQSGNGSSANTIKVSDCTANGLHGFISVYVDGLTVENCVVNTKNGINNQPANENGGITVNNCQITTEGYAARTNGGKIILKDSTIVVTGNEDGAIVLRSSTIGVELTDTTIDAEVDFEAQNGLSKSAIVGADADATYKGFAD